MQENPLKTYIERRMKNMTENKKEQELNDFFDGKSTSTISKVVKKAKRITILRNIGISLFVIVFLLITLSLSWLFILREVKKRRCVISSYLAESLILILSY